jgi:hypothetical protein
MLRHVGNGLCLLVVLTSFASCGDDDDDYGTAGRGGVSGSGGTSGSGGSKGGSGGTAGTGGIAGTGGSGGTSGSGGTGTDGGAGKGGSDGGAGTTGDGSAGKGGAEGGAGTSGSGGSAGSDASAGAGGTAGTGGTAGSGGTAGGAGTGGTSGVDAGPDTVDITGVWFTYVKTEGKFQVPGAESDADIVNNIRVEVVKSGSNYNFNTQFCKLETVMKPDPSTLVTTYTPAVMALLKGTASAPAPAAGHEVGSALNFPSVKIRAGSSKFCAGVPVAPDTAQPVLFDGEVGVDCAGTPTDFGDFPDADADGKLGISLPSVLSQGTPDEIALIAWSSLTISLINTNVKLVNENKITSTNSFSTYGEVQRMNVPAIAGGRIKVLPLAASIPTTFVRKAGVLTCDQINADIAKGWTP